VSFRLSICAVALALVFPASSGARSQVTFKLVAQGAPASDGDAPKTQADVVSSNSAAKKILRRWDLEKALPSLAKVDFDDSRLLILVARGTSTADRLEIRKVTLRAGHLTATGKIEADGIGGQVLTRAYALVTVSKRVKASSARLAL
jgi:hypothetical protein